VNCIICNKKKFIQVWNDKIRSGSKGYTKKKERIIRCLNCDLVFLKKRKKFLENSINSRILYNKNIKIPEFLKFHTKREMHKLNFIKKNINVKNKKILESNCGAGIIISDLKKKAKLTAGLDNIYYKDFLEKNNHLFFKDIKQIKKSKNKFDLIFSFSELEHKYNPVEFLRDLKTILNKKGKIILRVPNYNNIYMFLLGKKFLYDDYRTSHNYYFSIKNLFLLFQKIGFKIDYYKGINEYSFNHLLNYINYWDRVRGKKIKNFFLNLKDKKIVRNIENNFVSTSLIFILSK